MKIILTKEELLEFCSHCAEKSLSGGCSDKCVFGNECVGAYIDFWRDNTEVSDK